MPPSFRRRPLAAALVAAFAAPAYAADAVTPPAPAPAASSSTSATPAPQQMPAVKVEGKEENDYAPPAAVASPKYVAPILDTPQNITVISKEVIADQNVQTLRDILSNVPGITFGAGEGGGGYGDSISLRGYVGSNDITQDGIRDSAQITRSDPFNMEQVEIFLGSNSVYSGAGAVGGTINIVSKTPINEDATAIQAGVGTDQYGRLTVDANRKLGDGVAGRANLMVHRNDVPGRDVEEFERWGIAPSITLGLGSPTTLTLSYFHQEDDNVPQYGVPFRNNRKVPGVDNEDYFGYSNFDTQEIENDMFTAIVNHKFNDTVSARNLSRYGRATQHAIVDAPQGAICLAEGPAITPPTQFPPYPECTADEIGTLRPSGGPRGNWRDTENEILANQTDLTWRFQTFGMKHTLLTGAQFTHENYHLDNFALFRDENGEPLLLPLMDLSNPDHTYDGPVNKTLIAKTDGEMDNAAAYVFESLELTPRWIASGGVRYERNEGFAAPTGIKLYTPPSASNPEPDNSGIGGPGTATPPAHNDDDLLSYRAGLVFKPVKSGSVYVAYANSKTPSRATVNGTCVLSGVVNANCDLDPEKAENYEVGVKWELLDAQLVLT
ncbi:MAG TPA: TonB-dependent receptor, partial [Nevskiaceae bacterium]|nr:TonB-dependent receptor [Nevskiaceae bacterium]